MFFHPLQTERARERFFPMPHKRAPRRTPRAVRGATYQARMDRFCAAVRARGTIRAGCDAAEIDRPTLEVWQKKHPRFALAVDAAFADFQDGLDEMLLDNIKKGDAVSLRIKTRAEQARRLAVRRHPDADPDAMSMGALLRIKRYLEDQNRPFRSGK